MTEDIPLDMTGAAPLSTRGVAGQRDGCGCPQGIVRCAHLDDRVVWLDDAYVESSGGHAGRSPWDGERWHVVGPGTVILKCDCGKDHPTLPGSFIVTDSLADAEAEFERRCALLREVEA